MQRVVDGKAGPLVGNLIAPEVSAFFQANREPLRASILYWRHAFERHLKGKKQQLTEDLELDLRRALMTQKIAAHRLIKVVSNPREPHFGDLVSEPGKLLEKLEIAAATVQQKHALEQELALAKKIGGQQGEKKWKGWVAESANHLTAQRVFIDGESIKAIRQHLEEGNEQYIFGPKRGRK